ncbi:Transposon Tf2-6 polyprotein [Labeo rohita]|uniref:ribonuclease H n=1 Tax=Labeo rohita TaxID=84645 RepID=A0ABQ8L8T9_LABRO|nr:Transposon Tf2-6 polyprotein [Labeo rohita]
MNAEPSMSVLRGTESHHSKLPSPTFMTSGEYSTANSFCLNIPHISAELVFNSCLFPVHVLVDSGVAGNFISSQCLTDFKIPEVASETFYQISTIQGTPLGNGCINRRTVELELILNGNHSERLTLLVLPKATVDVILGDPWLTRHSPHIDWCSGEILGSVTIPSEYASYADVFSKEQATHLPPHRRWDCSIDLLPGARLPQGKIYPLSIPEREAMENYINEALKQGFIRPSTSPAVSSFFLVDKKDGGLRPCIDYRVLNESMVKFAYPLPLVPAALEELREAHVFTKLDLRSAYNLICIREGDEWKTAFVTPSGHYEYLVMPYGLVNSPSIFQNFMNEIFRDFLHHFVIVSIDDILIYSRDLQEHQKHVRQALSPCWTVLTHLRALDILAAGEPSRSYAITTGGPTWLRRQHALETAEALFQNVFRNFGLPEDIVSDRGPQFISRVWRAFFQLLGVTVSLSSGYHPQTNGQSERKMQEISRYLRYQPPLFPWSREASEVPAVDHWFQESERVWDSAHVHLQRAVWRHTENANVRRLPTHTHHPGDKVWLSTRDIRLRLPCKKLSPRYIGPYTIHSQINAVTYCLNLPPQYRISSSFHVSLLKPYIDPILPPPTGPELPPPPPQPEIIEDQIYRIQEILLS